MLGRDPLLPPRRLQRYGRGDFAETGDACLRRLLDLAGLEAGHRVLDVGCGDRADRAAAGRLPRSRSRQLRRLRRRAARRSAGAGAATPAAIPTSASCAPTSSTAASIPAARTGPPSTASRTPTRASTSSWRPPCSRTSSRRRRPTTSPRPPACWRPAGRLFATLFVLDADSRARIAAGGGDVPVPRRRRAVAVVSEDRPEEAVAYDERVAGRAARRVRPRTGDARARWLARARGRARPARHRGGAACVSSTSCTSAPRGSSAATSPRPACSSIPGPASAFDGLLERARRHRGAADPADPHPPRPRGRDGSARPPVPGSRGLGPRIGARHVVDPSRWSPRATRLYGDDMERLWGEIVPVPEANLRVLDGGEARRWVPGGVHARPRLAPRRLPARGQRHRPVRGRRGGADRRRPADRPDAAARHRRRRLAATRSTSSRAGGRSGWR